MAKPKLITTTKAPLKLDLKNIQPLTENQKLVFEAWEAGKHLFLYGCAGTGKTFISLYNMLTEFQKGKFRKIVIIRSAVSTRDIGFMPGGPEEKGEIYEEPYFQIFGKLFGRGDAYNIYLEKNIVDFRLTSFLRGITLDDSLILLDEIQNCNFEELLTVITRCGDNIKLCICGDSAQTDLRGAREKTGFFEFRSVIERMSSFESIEFGVEDIVRNGIVKEFIRNARALGLI